MTDGAEGKEETMVVSSTRFGDLRVSVASTIEFPSGLIGFPKHHRFIMIEHKPPFSWLQSVDDPALAFVVVDGYEFGQEYDLNPPYGDKSCDFREDDEFAILVIVTVGPDPRQTTANLKAPLFVNLRNRRGLQVIFDDPRYSTRFPLWSEEEDKKEGAEAQQTEGSPGAGDVPNDESSSE